jgi:putative ABC transport system permease protein
LYFQPVPFQSPDTLVAIHYPFSIERRLTVGAAAKERDRLESSGMAASFAFTAVGPLEVDAEESGTVAQAVTPNFFQMLGVAPIRGRLFVPQDANEKPLPVIIGETLWQERFGARESIIDSVESFGETRIRIVGVLPRQVRFPQGASIWSAMNAPDAAMPTFVRLESSISPKAFARAFPAFDVEPAANTMRGSPGPDVRFLWIVAGCAVLSMVGQLLVVQETASLRLRRSFQVKRSLGAQTADILAELLFTSMALVATALLIATPLAHFLTQWIWGSLPGDVRRMRWLDQDPVASAIMVVAVALVASAVHWVPQALAIGPFGASSLHKWFRSTMAARTQVALSVAAMVAAASAISSLSIASSAAPSLSASHLSAIEIPLLTNRRAEIFRALEELKSQRYVENVAVATTVPLARGGLRGTFQLRGSSDLKPFTVGSDVVSASYFETVGLALSRGRFPAIDESETVAVVTEELNRAAGESLLGERVSVSGMTGRVVGVVRSMGEYDPSASPLPRIYFVSPAVGNMLLVRTANSTTAAQALALVQRLAPTARSVAGPAAWRSRALAPYHGRAALLSLIAASVTMVTVLGIAACAAMKIHSALPELALRRALGATDGDIARWTLAKMTRPVVDGALVGVALGCLTLAILRSRVVGLVLADSRVVLGSVLAVSIISAVSVLIPALWLSRHQRLWSRASLRVL